MSEWNADFVNDPHNDYELTIEILYKNEDIAVIKKGKNGLEIVLLPHNKNVIIPFDWLLKLMNEARISIPVNFSNMCEDR